MELDLGRIVPDPSRTIRSGALAPWSTPAYQGFLQGLLDVAGQLDIPVDVPFQRLTDDQVQRLLEGVPGQRLHGTEGLFRGSRAPVVQAAGARIPEPVAALSTVPRLPRCPAAARGPGGQDRGARHRRSLGHDDPRRPPLHRRTGRLRGASRPRLPSWHRSIAGSATWRRSGSIT